MKKWFLLLVLVFFLIPNVYAIIELQEITPKVYNLGDKLKIAGSVSRESSFEGILKANLICNSDKSPVLSRSLDLVENEKYSFLEDVTIPTISTGDCSLNVFLEKNKETIEEKESETFKITKELNGNFVLVNNKIQLGDNVNISGDVFKINGKRVNGIATLYLKKNKENLFIDTENIENGKFGFNIPSSYISTGSYSLDFDVKDANGNGNTFVDAIKFDITNLLNIELKLDRDKINPGGDFEVIGSIRDIYGKRVDRGTFIVSFNDKKFEGNILLGDINKKILAENNIKTGFHSIFVEVKDESGNKGSGTLNIEVLSEEEAIELSLDKDSYKPGEKIKINVPVYDQGRDVLDKEVLIEIRDSSGAKRFGQKIGKEYFFELPLTSRPGEWYIKAVAGDLKTDKKFYVVEVRELSYKVEGQKLTVTNVGNVAFNDVLNVDLDGISASSTLNKKVYLEPGESMDIDLGREVNTGIYKVTINNKLFDNVKIEGRSLIEYKGNLNLLFIIIVLLILGFLLLKKRKFTFSRLKRFFIREKKEYFSMDELNKLAQNKIWEGEKFIKKQTQNIAAKENKMFKDYVTIKPSEEKLDNYRKGSSYLKRREKENEHFKEGLFNMFK